jgi:heat shock protein HslJ
MRKLILAILFLAIGIAGCKSTQKAPETPKQPIPMATAELTETHWKMIELMGKPVVLSENNKKEIYIVLSKDGSSVNGFSGCNSIMGKYELKEGNRITFSSMASTMMACPDLATESEFNKMLGTIDNYSINGSAMTLNKAKMAPMAKFVPVEQTKTEK